MSKTPAQPIFASASSPSSADELLGKLAAYRPVEIREIETKLGMSEATIAQVVEITDAGDSINLGERPVFWQVVRRQLATATEEVPWVVGRLTKTGPAYRLEGIADTDGPAIQRALAGIPE